MQFTIRKSIVFIEFHGITKIHSMCHSKTYEWWHFEWSVRAFITSISLYNFKLSLFIESAFCEFPKKFFSPLHIEIVTCYIQLNRTHINFSIFIKYQLQITLKAISTMSRCYDLTKIIITMIDKLWDNLSKPEALYAKQANWGEKRRQTAN